MDEPRSPVHATLKLDNGQLFVRDEGSNNGSFVGGIKLQPFAWTSVVHGAKIKFGPIEFSVELG